MQDDFSEWVDSLNLPKLELNVTLDGLLPGVDRMLSCVGTRPQEEGACPWMTSARELLEEQRETLENRLEYADQQVDAFVEKSDEYKASVLEKVQNSRDFFNGIQEAVASASIDTSEWGDWYNVELSDLVPQDVAWPGGLPDFPAVPDLDDVWEEVGESFEEVSE